MLLTVKIAIVVADDIHARTLSKTLVTTRLLGSAIIPHRRAIWGHSRRN
jgi:hypothetical protein